MKLKTSTRNYQDRLSICNKCDHFRKSIKQCKKCGCFMKIKAAIAFTRCPIGKWDREHEITQDQLSILRRILNDINGTTVSKDQNVGLTNLYNEIFGMKKSVSSCGSCVKQLVKDLKQILESYED